MRILWNWLLELVNIPESPEAFADRLTRAGLEVESIYSYRRLSPALSRIFVGEILTLEPHPEGKKLWIAQVRLAPEKVVSVITAASNIQIGDKVPVALPGSQVWKDGRWTTIEPRTFGGIRSEGMLCSEVELNVGEDSGGILHLPPETTIGLPLSQVLEDYTDVVLEINPTPNRGDALSHWGIAREYAALTGATPSLPSWQVQKERIPFPLRIQVEDLEACPRYGGVYIEGIEEKGVLPSLLRYRLEAVGMRLIHPVVDITNYILIGFGQPLHAFDAERISGKILRVSLLSESVMMEGIGEQILKLQKNDLVIADEEGPACLAGLLGAKRTAITASTRRVFIESAYFSPLYIRRTGRRLQLHTESGYRFMRGTDPDKVPWAAEAAAALIQQVYPGAFVSQYEEIHDRQRTAPRQFSISLPLLRQWTSLPLPSHTLKLFLSRLEIQVHPRSSEEWEVAVPLYRLDITRPADIAEELLRLSGWETLVSLPHSFVPYARPSEIDMRFELRRFLSEVLTGMGFWEIRTPSLVGAHHLLPNSTTQLVKLANPLYEGVAYLRPSLIGSGLEVISHNRKHGVSGLWAFEWGRVYSKEGEEERLALWGWGRPPFQDLQHKVDPSSYFFSALRALFHRVGISYLEKPLPPTEVWQEGLCFYDEEGAFAEAGALSRPFLKKFDLQNERVWAAEISFHFYRKALFQVPLFKKFSYHPVVVKDISFYMPSDLSYADVIATIRDLKHPYLQRIEPFDWYRDEEGRLSYGLRFYLQGDHTLTDTEIHEFLAEVVRALEKKGAQVRKAETI
ncbi:MAG: phenylalanine--tRNA ligase subunit beta [Bacteroidia bacterium]|nr:phenylalanine--tRNA ligase subunit beta [Bacteroidia bacterium]